MKLAEFCHKHSIIVISDEIHSDMALWGNTHIPFASVSPKAAECSITFGAAPWVNAAMVAIGANMSGDASSLTSSQWKKRRMSIDIRRYEASTDKDRWDEFIATSARNATFLHCRGYMDYHSDRFNDMSLMAYKGMVYGLRNSFR